MTAERNLPASFWRSLATYGWAFASNTSPRRNGIYSYAGIHGGFTGISSELLTRGQAAYYRSVVPPAFAAPTRYVVYGSRCVKICGTTTVTARPVIRDPPFSGTRGPRVSDSDYKGIIVHQRELVKEKKYLLRHFVSLHRKSAFPLVKFNKRGCYVLVYFQESLR